MAESKYAPWMTAASTFVGVLAFIFALFQYRAQESSKQVEHWQRVVIHKLIAESNGIPFNDLKLRYITEAAQFQIVSLPAKDIQDDALRHVLLDLQREKLVYLDGRHSYHATIETPAQGDDVVATMKDRMKRENEITLARPAILRFVERESGLLSTEEIIQRCREQKVQISDEDVYNLIADLRSQRVVQKDEAGKLWATHEVEARPSTHSRPRWTPKTGH
jgi:hypothetical protein